MPILAAWLTRLRYTARHRPTAAVITEIRKPKTNYQLAA